VGNEPGNGLHYERAAESADRRRVVQPTEHRFFTSWLTTLAFVLFVCFWLVFFIVGIYGFIMGARCCTLTSHTYIHSYICTFTLAIRVHRSIQLSVHLSCFPGPVTANWKRLQGCNTGYCVVIAWAPSSISLPSPPYHLCSAASVLASVMQLPRLSVRPSVRGSPAQWSIS
jgi:hypothetical protein